MTTTPVGGHAQALATATPDSSPTCAEDLRLLDQRIRSDYAGFTLEIKGVRARQYQQELSALGARAAPSHGADCFVVLNDLTRWFHDPHVFLYETTRLDTAETTRRARAVAMVDMGEAKARAYFTRRITSLDPIEGIWYDGPLRLAVVPDPKSRARHFVAVVLTPDTTIWRPGAVRARIVRHPSAGYTVTLWERNYAIHHRDGEIYKHRLLRLSPGMWGKSFPIAPADSFLIDSTDVHRPTLIVHPGTVVVSVPSHDPQYKPLLDSLITIHATDLLNTSRLIIDLRGNEGGGSFMTDGLMPYIASTHEPPGLLEDNQPVMLSSEDQIRYARQAFGSDTASLRRLLGRMQSHLGGFVLLADSADPPPAPSADSVIVGPRRVGILIDRGTVSASEVLVLEALRSVRVTVFGERTAGALDYESVNIVSFSPRERRWYLGYPTITRSITLPVGGMRGRGIAPTVRFDLKHTPDPIAAVERMLMKRE